MSKILITGIGGFIGSNLADYLSKNGHDVFGFDCVISTRPKNCPVEVLDILNKGALLSYLDRTKPDVVYHLAARTDLLGKSMADYDANIKGVENLLAACSATPTVTRVVFASSRMVCRIDHIPENYDDYTAPNYYGQSKVEGERIVRNSGAKFEWVLVRPTSIWGPGFGIPYRNFFDQVRRNRYVHPGKRRPRKSFGYIGNTVYQLAALLVARSESIHGKTFYLGDYDPIDVADWADYIHRLFGFTQPIRSVPIPILRIVAKTGDLVNCISRKDKAPLTTFRLNNLVTDMVYPLLEDLRVVTGPLPYSWKEGTERTVAWMKTTV